MEYANVTSIPQECTPYIVINYSLTINILTMRKDTVIVYMYQLPWWLCGHYLFLITRVTGSCIATLKCTKFKE